MSRHTFIAVLMTVLSAGMLVVIYGLYVASETGKDVPAATVPVRTAIKGTVTPKVTPRREPEIGMSYLDFTDYCGDYTRSTWSRGSYGERAVYFYADTDKRWKKRCVGYFTFENDVLVAIHSIY